MRKRDRLYTSARNSNLSSAWTKSRQYRKKVVKQAHINYVNNVVGSSLAEKPKTFWSYVKLMKIENMSIPPLRSREKLCTTDKDLGVCP